MCTNGRFSSWADTKEALSRSVEISKRHLRFQCTSETRQLTCNGSPFREHKFLGVMMDKLSQADRRRSVTRRRFLGLSLASGAGFLTGKSDVIFGADSSTTPNMAM